MPLMARIVSGRCSVAACAGMMSHRAKQLSSSSSVYQRILSLYTACAVENSRPSNPPREAAGHERMAPGWLRREHGRRVRPGTSTAALKAPNSPLVTDRQRPTWATWLMIRVFDSWLPALDLDESVVAIGAPGLAGGVEVGDRGRVQTRDDI